MIWSVLGIEETKDRKEITRAYRERLSGIELEEKYPSDFIEYVILYRAHTEDNFPYSLFTPGVDGKAALQPPHQIKRGNFI